MAITAYCKKCKADVPVGETCPICGGRLAASSARVVWCVERVPVKDWLCWNALIRVVMPVYTVTIVLILALEALFGGGIQAVEQLLRGGLLWTLLTILCVVLLLCMTLLICRGRENRAFVVDSKGARMEIYLPHPTALQLLCRLQPPSLLRQEEAYTTLGLKTAERSISWKQLSRVELWPGKPLLLLYSPSWWMALYLDCMPSVFADVMSFLRGKVGRRKDLLLPEDLRTPPKPRAPRAAKSAVKPVKAADAPAFDAPMADAPLEPRDAAEMSVLLGELHDAAQSETFPPMAEDADEPMDAPPPREF